MSGPLFLVDTNVLSELVRPEPDEGVTGWFGEGHDLAVSPVTIEELTFGISRLKGRKRQMLESWLERLLGLSLRVLPVDEVVGRRAGELRSTRSKRGRAVSQADMLIAASAQLHGATIVTRNTKDFSGLAIPILNPFRG